MNLPRRQGSKKGGQGEGVKGDGGVSTSNSSDSPSADQLGFELDETRPFGQNSAWAPQGGQTSEPKPPDEPTHIGRTQSTTNSQ